MPYVLGVDVGNTHTTAALHFDGDGGATVLPLDEGRPWVHSVLYLSPDDAVLVGRDALARAQTEPERVARGLGERVGDPVAPLLGGLPCPAEMLLAALTRWVVDRAIERAGAEPERVVLTNPVSWGPHRRTVLDHALRQIGLADVVLLPKPLAAAENHAATNPVAAGDAVAVYDLGGTALSCAVARLGPAGFELLSRVETGEAAGGTQLDDVLVTHVLAELGRTPADLDPFDDELVPALAELREACRTARHTLGTAAEAIIPTPLLGPPSSVLVTRAEFEELISQAVYRTVDVLRQAIRSSGVPAARLTAVALAGGSARIPLVTELVTAAVPVPVVLDPDPDTAVARGAALAGRRVVTPEVQVPEEDVHLPQPRDQAELDAPTQPPRPPVDVAPIELPRRRWKVVSRSRRRAD